MQRDVYSGRLKLYGEEHRDPPSSQQLRVDPCHSTRFEEAKSLLRKTMPVARRVLGESNDLTLKMRMELRAGALQGRWRDARRSPRGRDDARGRGADRARVLGGAHPLTSGN